MAPRADGPRISVVVPARNCAGHLRLCLERLQASIFRDFEVVVVDDASTDDTGATATAQGARLLRLERRAGPAAARNRGAAEARGELLLFLDADVGVHPDTLGAVAAAFDGHTGLDALFGSYDTRPSAPGLVSQYRNLFHHFVHQQGRERATTFWSGCGAIRRSLFLAHGGFDAQLFPRPSIEDIELGARLVRAGACIVVTKHVQVTHMKRWTPWDVVRTDVLQRGIPWTRLILREGRLPDDLNVSTSQRVCLGLVALLLVAFAAAAWQHPWLLFLPPAVLTALVIGDHLSARGPPSAALRRSAALAAAAALGAMAAHLPAWTTVMAALVLLVVLLNHRLYAFFACTRGLLFAICAVPLHLLYYTCSGLALITGVVQHLATRRPARADATS